MTTTTGSPLPLLAEPRFGTGLSGVRVDRQGFGRGIRPVGYVGRRIKVPTRPRNSAASGQLLENASRTRLAFSLIRPAIFNNRSRMVENSPLASGWSLGIASRIVRTSQ